MMLHHHQHPVHIEVCSFVCNIYKSTHKYDIWIFPLYRDANTGPEQETHVITGVTTTKTKTTRTTRTTGCRNM